MTAANCSLIELAARLLKPEEREAVLGDLAESDESGAQKFFAVLGLAARRHILLWKNWRPWLAAFGLALPCSFLLMGVSLSVSQSYQKIIEPAILRATGVNVGAGFLLFVCNVLLLIGWSWTGGFVVGSISRRTIWVSGALTFVPCLFCLVRFHLESMSRFCLLLFLVPALWGVRRGLQIAQIRLSSALILAMSVTLLTIPTWGSSGPWIPNWALSWPAWYLVLTAWKRNREVLAN